MQTQNDFHPAILTWTRDETWQKEEGHHLDEPTAQKTYLEFD